ncbi:MAG: glucosamine--fructose-6-phosphate aminotransferase (isomerizing) [Bacteroidia bacterium]|jgi:glucosamine--fructose-6-phosphate aminotransferase (isomerizing)
MCGIVGAAARREVSEILLEGLRRLEYRGYDSAGMALINADQQLQMHKRKGKVSELESAQNDQPYHGLTGIAHTRWATHGEPSQNNSHPHTSGNRLALVHNGIIENHVALREELVADGYQMASATDSEVIVHLMHRELESGATMIDALKNTVARLDGAYAIAAIDKHNPHEVVGAREGSPLVVGIGIGENFLASDQMALRQVTDRFIYLEEGDMVQITPSSLQVYTAAGEPVIRPRTRISEAVETSDKGTYDHFMIKEIFEQPRSIEATFAQATDYQQLEERFGEGAGALFDRVQNVQIVACGTSYHAGLVARYWLEEIAGVACEVEVASEFRYRKRVQHEGTLLVAISQSGETADTLAALRNATEGEFIGSLVVANVDNSSLVRECDLVFLTKAGAEIGVASTKAFTTQLVGLLMLTLALGRRRGMEPDRARDIMDALRKLPGFVAETLQMNDAIQKLSEEFIPKHHALFLGRGIQYPIAMEGALKLKEISYIHAEAYPAGELKHGPLALVDDDMPVVAVAPNDELLEKLKSNLEEVRSRGGELFVFADKEAGFENEDRITVLPVPHCPEVIKPIVYCVALQLLSYHVAVQKGTDVDKPRNLAKSVTVE